jgi:hypothetical protein
MEADSPKVVRTTDQTTETPEVEGWVSPEIAAAQAGERVEFGKNVVEATPEEEID